MHLYFGCYGPHVFRSTLDEETGELSPPVAAGECRNGSFLALHPTLPVLYAATEAGPDGGVASYTINDETGDLTLINQQTTGGGGTCYVGVGGNGKVVLAANYGGGSVAAFPVQDDGSLGERSFFDQHEGSGPVEGRQEGPHAHCFRGAPGGRFAVSCDLGTDEIFVYRIADDGSVSKNDPSSIKTKAGMGPRHVDWSPDGRHLYVLGELDNTLAAYAWDGERGTAELLGAAPLLPESFDAFSKAAEVAVHPTGEFVYGSNRGHDSIAVFRRDAESGLLTPGGHATQGVDEPRHFALTPDGRRMVVASQDANTAIVFDVCEETGELLPAAGNGITIEKAVCVLFRRS